MSGAAQVRDAAPGDALGIFAVEKAAFGQDDEARLVEALHAEGAVLASLVAEIDGVIVGHALFSRLWIEAEGARTPAVALAPVAVAPAFQRRGIGELLIFEGLARVKAAGERIVHVLGHPDYYPRFGFSAEAAEGLTSPWGGGPASMALAFEGAVPAGTLVYPAAFASMA